MNTESQIKINQIVCSYLPGTVNVISCHEFKLSFKFFLKHRNLVLVDKHDISIPGGSICDMLVMISVDFKPFLANTSSSIDLQIAFVRSISAWAVE